MHKRILSFVVISIGVSCIFLSAHVAAASNTIMVQAIQTQGESGTNVATQELIEVTNSSQSTIDLTGWCVGYAASTNTAVPTTTKGCVSFSDATHLLLSTGQSVVFATDDYQTAHPDVSVDFHLSSGLSSSAGRVYLFDASGSVIDRVEWGTVTSPESHPVNVSGGVIAFAKGDLIDTDDNSHDFSQLLGTSYVPHFEHGTEEIDLCSNIDGIQLAIPSGYILSEGVCIAPTNDVCPNIPGDQISVPDGMVQDEQDNCVIDVCDNIDGIQLIVPEGYRVVETSCMQLERRALVLSELLANSSGSDTGHEFIEIYNPYAGPILITGYHLDIGKSFEKSYLLQPRNNNTYIPARGYLIYSDSELGFSLLNTTGGVRLVAPAGNTVSETSYIDPSDDMAWALVDDIWQYTDIPTPGAANLAASESGTGGLGGGGVLAACPASKYRNPLTNRCRNIEADATVLASCSDDEYRNPETNRCRKIGSTTASLVACQQGYERNPATNRCRMVTSAGSTLTPCQAGYERNPDTNRCRKVPLVVGIGSDLGEVASKAAIKTSDIFRNSIVAMTVAGALGYGVYEWRSEIRKGLNRIAHIGRK